MWLELCTPALVYKVIELTDAMTPENRTDVQLTTGEWMIGFGVETLLSSPSFWNQIRKFC